MNDTPLRIGTRGSPLALAQAYETRDKLMAAFPELSGEGQIEIVVIKTTGDAVLDRALQDIGGKGLFTKEIDEAMLARDIDIAVHSMKDVPTYLPDGIHLPCMLEREDVRDVFISNKAKSVWDLPQGAVVGSASLRRQSQILARRPDLKVVTFRGNVQTRMKKLDAGEVDGTLLAAAGLRRLGMEEVITDLMDAEDFIPAVGQGAIGITCMEDDERANRVLAALNHDETVVRVTAERAFLAVLDGSCRTPIAAYSRLEGETLHFHGLVAKPDGSEVHHITRTSAADLAAAETMGRDAGQELKDKIGPDFLATAG
ncbi:hydroxymethylbilane synthase [Magnetovibrio sp.]|uniref:hydroxymethylbilane synthase n=1 Tax=Magnetovibrio sp. TaxID=2024836 RepID=UPI002F94625F